MGACVTEGPGAGEQTFHPFYVDCLFPCHTGHAFSFLVGQGSGLFYWSGGIIKFKIREMDKKGSFGGGRELPYKSKTLCDDCVMRELSGNLDYCSDRFCVGECIQLLKQDHRRRRGRGSSVPRKK